MSVRAEEQASVVDGGVGELVLMWGGFPLLGAGLGAALTAVAGWLADLPWVPFQGWFELLAGLPERPALAGGTALPALAGLLVAYVGTRERLTVTVDRTAVRLHRDGHARDLARASVATVFVDGRTLVLLDSDGAELAREKSDLSGDRLRAAFTAQGWPWHESDPHRDAYRRWVEGLPGLPAGADALLRARQRAVDAHHRDDARDLRRELARLGVVVRDSDGRQYWRLVRLPLHPEETGDGR